MCGDGLCSELVFDVWCYILYYILYVYYYISYILYYYTIIYYILYYILYYTLLSPIIPSSSHLLFPSSILLPSSSPPLLSPSQYPSPPISSSTSSLSFYTCRVLHILIYIIQFYSPLPKLLLFSSLLLFPSSFLILFSSLFFLLLYLLSSQYSFYTCRYLHMVIYVLSVSNNSTPHVLSEWMVEV